MVATVVVVVQWSERLPSTPMMQVLILFSLKRQIVFKKVFYVKSLKRFPIKPHFPVKNRAFVPSKFKHKLYPYYSTKYYCKYKCVILSLPRSQEVATTSRDTKILDLYEGLTPFSAQICATITASPLLLSFFCRESLSRTVMASSSNNAPTDGGITASDLVRSNPGLASIV